MRTLLALVFFGALGWSLCAVSANPPTPKDTDKLRTFYGLDAYSIHSNLKTLKIAVLDNGFAGYEAGKGYLPDNTEFIQTYPADFITKYGLGKPEDNVPLREIDHGRLMAQIAWALAGRTQQGPQFYLLNANGITNFRRAVKYATLQKVDIILYSQNWECCGNFDGQGFINSVVAEATDNGALWINAAGNYGGQVYNGRVQVGSDGFLTFGNQQSLRLKSHFDQNPVQIVLNWNSYGSTETTGTEKNLDMFLYDSSGNQVAQSELVQVQEKAALAEGETFLPRERIRTTLDASEQPYTLRIKAKSKNFGSDDNIKLVVIPEKSSVFDPEKNHPVEAVQLLDATPGSEIMVPADSPKVITVGDLQTYSASGPTADGRIKPEILLQQSDIVFTDGNGTNGTSNAAAIFAGIIAVLKSHNLGLTREMILKYAAAASENPGTAPSPIAGVTLNEVYKAHPFLLQVLEQETGEAPLLQGRYIDGRYAVATRMSPESIIKNLCSSISTNGFSSYEYYLVQTRLAPSASCQFGRNVSCCVRKTYPEADRYPWEIYTSVNRRSFLEVRAGIKTDANSPKPPASNLKRVWKTPNPGEL